MAKRGLGKGLGALLPPEAPSGEPQVMKIPIDQIVGAPYQPRQDFQEEGLEEMAATIKTHGLIQPIVVRPLEPGKYEIVAGERRWRASKMAGLKEIPAIVKELAPREAAEMALIENLQREDLTPLEEARAYQILIQEFGITQEELALRLGKSRPAIANALRLLQLPAEVQKMLQEGSITAGHARALLSLKDPHLQQNLASRIAGEGMTVREAEALAKQMASQGERGPKKGREPGETPEIRHLEERLQGHLGTKVRLKGQERGKIEIYFHSPEERERLLSLLLSF